MESDYKVLRTNNILLQRPINKAQNDISSFLPASCNSSIHLPATLRRDERSEAHVSSFHPQLSIHTMEVEQQLEPRVKPLSYKVKATSRESSSSQKASHVLDPDLRSHWSTGTNTKEWILLELDEPCLLSHIRIYNKSVLEWEIAVGLRYKPETFVKVRARCEAPRREMMYPMSYTACRYVRISCLRGNPIAIFFIQLIGVSVIGLEAEFQPVVNFLLPHIISHKQDTYDLHLQLLQDITNRMLVFLPQLEADLTNFLDDAESNIRFLAMLSGPFYPILHLVIERLSGGISDSDASKPLQPSLALSVSSNFEPRKSRSASLSVVPTSSSAAFRPDAVILLLRKAYRDPNLKNICRLACQILQKLTTPIVVEETPVLSNDVTASGLEETLQSESAGNFFLIDYSDLFGEEFRISDLDYDMRHLNLLDIGAVEEGILHVLYASASQPSLRRMLAHDSFDLWSALPLVQALLPALRPCFSGSDHIDEDFSQWQQPFVQKALSQIVATSSSSLYRPLLRACAGCLCSFSPSHAKAACVLIDLCSSLLAPWTPLVIGKVDLALELTEDCLGVIQNSRHSSAHPRARAALKYILLALYGHMDNVLAKYKEVKHETLFLLEMLEPFLDPAIITSQNTISFGDLSTVYSEKQENDCAFALNLIRTAVLKPGVLASLEAEWRRGTVSPSVLLKIIDPHATFPAEIDFRKPLTKVIEPESSSAYFSSYPGGGAPTKPYSQEDSEGKVDVSDAALKMDASEDVSLFFAPPEFRTLVLSDTGSTPESSFNFVSTENIMEDKSSLGKNLTSQINKVLRLCNGSPIDFFNLHADYLQLHNYPECELRASEFQCLASDLNSQSIITPECHDASIDALLLAAECYVNPLFMFSFTTSSQKATENSKILQKCEIAEVRRVFSEINSLEKLADVEWKRDKIVLRILLEAAKLDRSYEEKLGGGHSACYGECSDEDIINLSTLDVETADAVTLVRQNQALLCKFLVKQLQNGQHSLHEILMQSLIFLLQSATKLFCSPEDVIDVILRSAEYLNVMLTLLYYQFKEGNRLVDTGKAHEVHRCWVLLQKLVFVSSGANQEPGKVNFGRISLFGNLIPPSAWLNRIPTFSSSAFPLVRFLGWMAVSRIAKNYMNERVFLSSGLSQLTYLLSIYADELALTSNSAYEKNHDLKNGVEKDIRLRGDKSVSAVYPDLSYFFPEMKQQFEAFGVAILESVGLQLRSFPSSSVPDILCWFSDLCTWPFLLKERNSTRDSTDYMKGYVVKNAKAIILFILEAIVIEHMESIAPEVPRVVQVLVSICRSSFCDVSFLESILCLLKPIISYSLSKVPYEEKLLTDYTCINFESLCFAELFNNIKHKKEDQGSPADKAYSRALTIFILASLFLDLSFQRKRDFLQSLCSWADFASSEPTTTFHDYFSAFLLVLDSSKVLLMERLRIIGAIPLQISHSEVSRIGLRGNISCFLNDIFRDDASSGCETGDTDEVMNGNTSLSNEDVDNMCKDLEGLISKLYQTIDLAWKLHPLLAKKLTVASAECFVYGRCLSSISSKSDSAAVHDTENTCISDKFDQFSVHWKLSLQGFAEYILILQERHCWEVAYVLLDCLLGVPKSFSLDNVVTIICFAIKNFACNAPQISWRLQTRKWLSVLFARGIHIFSGSEISLAELFQTMLGHPEPEQRCIALQCLTSLLGDDVDDGRPVLSLSNRGCECPQDTYMSEHRKILSHLISNAWDQASSLAAADSSLIIRTRAMTLLIDSVPFVERPKLQSFLSAADSVLHGLGKLELSTCEGPLFQLSLALIANACLYSPSVDIALIPEQVWADIETLGESRTGKIGDLEKKACQALNKLRNEGDDYKEVLKEVLSSSFSKQFNPEFEATRESIIQVIAGLTSIQSYFDVFVEEIDEETKELEEAEIELEMVQKDKSLQDSSEHFKEPCHPLSPTSSMKGGSRLKQIKDSIHALEKYEIREAISARRQMKLLARRARQKYLEEAALREAELLQNLDRERTTEAEKEIERERLLELERAKTRELRHSLEMEKERQTQRDLQRELEQAESGLRTSRREFSSSTHASRPRDRYRERDGRSTIEGNIRTSSGNLQPETSTSMGTTPAIVSSGSRTFPIQPTILQARDRQDDCGSNYEENFEGSKDSGDAGSIGDPETFDSLSDRYGSTQRPSRGSKTKQGMERRERDGRRESKWERKH